MDLSSNFFTGKYIFSNITEYKTEQSMFEIKFFITEEKTFFFIEEFLENEQVKVQVKNCSTEQLFEPEYDVYDTFFVTRPLRFSKYLNRWRIICKEIGKTPKEIKTGHLVVTN